MIIIFIIIVVHGVYNLYFGFAQKDGEPTKNGRVDESRARRHRRAPHHRRALVSRMPGGGGAPHTHVRARTNTLTHPYKHTRTRVT